MSVTRQLYQLQEIDLELESNEQALQQLTSQLGESKAMLQLRDRLTNERHHLEELGQQQRSLEWEIDDITNKLTTAEQELYSGRIHNPKELANLQQDTDGLKTRRAHLEDRTLEIMNQAEMDTTTIATTEITLKTREAEWQSQQQQLSAEMEQLKAVLSNLKHKRHLLAAEIDSETVEVYQTLRKQKKTAVAKVEQGICHGCRISLPATELQSTKSGRLIRCSSCGRILFSA